MMLARVLRLPMNFNSCVLFLGLFKLFSSKQVCASTIDSDSKATAIAQALSETLGTNMETVNSITDILSSSDFESCNNIKIMSALILLSKYKVLNAVMGIIDDICDAQMKAFLLINLFNRLPSRRMQYGLDTGCLTRITDDEFLIANQSLLVLSESPFNPPLGDLRDGRTEE